MGDLDGLIRRFFEWQWDEFPESASALGLDGYDDRLGVYSEDAIRAREASLDGWLRDFESVDAATLTPDDLIDRDLVVSALRGAIIEREWAGWRRNPVTYLGPGLGAVFDLFLHRVRPERELAASAASRLRQVPANLEHGKANLDPTLVAPIFVERAIGMCEGAIGYAREVVPSEVSDPADRALLAEAGEAAAAAYEDFLSFLQELEPTGDYAIGEDIYSRTLRDQEMLAYGAREMRDRGRAEFDAIAEDMRRRARNLRGTEDWPAVIRELNADHPSTPEEMRALYEDWTARARAFLVERGLVSFRDGERCMVEPSPPFQRAVMAVASYNPPPFLKPSLTGHFFVPYPPDGMPSEQVQERLSHNSRMTIPTVAVHEAYPGHHWHLITMGANPRLARKVLYSSYFAEGWGLYVEQMMLDEGFYDDPVHELGAREARIFRAARVVIDTSLHIGEMSFSDAVRFMVDELGTPEAAARAEVGRYCSWPTQAPSYMTGALEIERMRAAYLADGRGDLRRFHDTIAASGSMPVALAERALSV